MDECATRIRSVKMMRGHAVTEAGQTIKHMAETIKQCAQEVKGYTEKFDMADNANDRASVMSWAVNAIANLQNNLRLDMVVTAAARMVQAEASFERVSELSDETK